jgi:MAternally affected uncoordination
MIENYQTNNMYQIESLKVFFLVLQVTYFIQCGQMKSVRNTLKSLQHYIQSLAGRIESDNEQTLMVSTNAFDNFHWMNKDHLGILVYLLTVVHSLQTGSLDKAQKFSEKALVNLEKLKLKEQSMLKAVSTSSHIPQGGFNNTTFGCSTFITNRFHVMFLENLIRCNIATGSRTNAIRQIGEALEICERDARLFHSQSAQLHCLIGLYSLSMNMKENALKQFNIALQSTSDTDFWFYCAMNMAICYLGLLPTQPNTKSQLMGIIEKVLPETIQTQNTALTASAHFFRSLKFFLNANNQQAQLVLFY